MKVPAPHFLLFSESSRKQRQGQWRFKLQAVDGSSKLEAADAETDIQGERLELLAVVRGLEALDQPSRVTLVTPSKYVHRGLLYGLDEWRTNGWFWEHFGQMVPVKNRDLWQRLDRAMSVHELEFQPWRWDPAVCSTPTALGDGVLALARAATDATPQLLISQPLVDIAGQPEIGGLRLVRWLSQWFATAPQWLAVAWQRLKAYLPAQKPVAT